MKKLIRNLLKILLLTLHTSVKGLNLETSLPEKLYLHKLDKLGFPMNYFLSGMQVTQQVFPEPYITMNEKNIKIKELTVPLIENSRITEVFMLNPLETLIVMDQNLLFLLRLSKNMEIRYIQKLELKVGSQKLIIHDIKKRQGVYFLTGIYKGESDQWNCLLVAFEFNESKGKESIFIDQDDIQEIIQLREKGRVTFNTFLSSSTNTIDKALITISPINLINTNETVPQHEKETIRIVVNQVKTGKDIESKLSPSL